MTKDTNPYKVLKNVIDRLCHDLKNPLSVIKLNSDLFKMSSEYKSGKNVTRKYVGIVQKEVRVILKKLNEIK